MENKKIYRVITEITELPINNKTWVEILRSLKFAYNLLKIETFAFVIDQGICYWIFQIPKKCINPDVSKILKTKIIKPTSMIKEILTRDELLESLYFAFNSPVHSGLAKTPYDYIYTTLNSWSKYFLNIKLPSELHDRKWLLNNYKKLTWSQLQRKILG